MNERQPVSGVYGPQAHLMRVGGTLYRTTTALNMRSGPGVAYPKIIRTPLPAGTLLQDVGYIRRDLLRFYQDPPQSVEPWKHVEFGLTDRAPVRGWVHGAYLERV